MTRTATRVAAAVGATVVMMGLATPALACTNVDGDGRTAAVSSEQAKNDPGKAFGDGKHDPSLTLAEAQAKLDEKIAARLAWVDAIEAKVAASDRLSDEQKTAFLAHLQGKEDALTQLRADVAAATTLDGLKAVLKASAADLFGFRHHGWGHHQGGRHHGGDNGNNGDNANRSDNDNRGDSDNRGVSDHGGSDHADSNHGGGFHH